MVLWWVALLENDWVDELVEETVVIQAVQLECTSVVMMERMSVLRMVDGMVVWMEVLRVDQRVAKKVSEMAVLLVENKVDQLVRQKVKKMVDLMASQKAVQKVDQSDDDWVEMTEYKQALELVVSWVC